MTRPLRETAIPQTVTDHLMQPYIGIPDGDETHLELVALSTQLLDEKDKMIINAIYYECLTYEELGRRLGCSKPHAWRLTRQAVARLGALLGQSTHIRERYALDE